MGDKINIGIQGEKMASAHLMEKGYEIIICNYRYKHSEIDIVAKIDDILVFVEVKARSSSSFGNPEEAINEKKIAKIIQGAEHYIYDNDWHGRIRFDIIAVELPSNKITHFEDAFG